MTTVGNEKHIIFDPFCLDLANESLLRGSQAIKLRPKAFAVLDYLLGRPGRLVTKEELLNAVWPGTFVGEAVLKVAIRQIRGALRDDPKSPRFIETAHRRGYRFIGQIAESGQTPTNDPEIRSKRAVSGSPLRAEDAPQEVVGRDETLSRMRSWLEKTLGGERQIVFVIGEAGLGKTALVDRAQHCFGSEHSDRSTAMSETVPSYPPAKPPGRQVAFVASVIQFRPETDIEARRFDGRIEHIASYKATRFHSLDELFDFMASVLTEVRNTEQKETSPLLETMLATG